MVAHTQLILLLNAKYTETIMQNHKIGDIEFCRQCRLCTFSRIPLKVKTTRNGGGGGGGEFPWVSEVIGNWVFSKVPDYPPCFVQSMLSEVSPTEYLTITYQPHIKCQSTFSFNRVIATKWYNVSGDRSDRPGSCYLVIQTYTFLLLYYQVLIL